MESWSRSRVVNRRWSGIKEKQVGDAFVPSKGVTGLVLGDDPAMLTRTQVGWVLAAGGEERRGRNYKKRREGVERMLLA